MWLAAEKQEGRRERSDDGGELDPGLSGLSLAAGCRAKKSGSISFVPTRRKSRPGLAASASGRSLVSTSEKAN